MDGLHDEGGRISSDGESRVRLCWGVSWGSEVLSSGMRVGREQKEGRARRVVAQVIS